MMNMPFMRQKKMNTRNITVGVTSIGKQKHEQWEGDGPQFEVMSYVAESGPSTIGEISQGTGINPNKVEQIVKMYIQRNHMRVMRGDESVGE